MAWAYKITLTADHTQCGATDSSNFPVLVSLTNTLLKTTGGQITHTGTQSGGVAVTMPLDLIFTSDSAGATKIPWEIESYNPATGLLIAWVQAGTLSHTVDTVFYCFFGDSAVTTQQNTSTFAPANVWQDKAIYHLADSTNLLVDSTSNANTLTNINTATAVAGNIGGGVGLASASLQELKRTANLSGKSQTISAWVNFTSFANTYNTVATLNDNTNGFNFFGMHVKSSGKLAFYIGSPSVNYDGTGTNTLSTGTWYLLAMAYDSAAGLTGYVNGAVDKFVANVGNMGIIPTQLEIGNDQPFSPRYVNGVVDEVRVAHAVRSVDWILAMYNNQKSGSTFLGASFAALTSGHLFRLSLLNGLGAGGPFFGNPLG